jgi:chaperonin cofactor prefoldin
MATLIQSKQIQGVVTASVIEGDFVTQGSITGSSISASQVLGVKYDDIEGTPNFIGGTGITITEVGDTITITNTGGGGGVSGSSELISSVAQLNAYTASTDIRLDGLSSQTGSYLTSLPTNLVSGSDQLTSSYDQRYALSGSVGGDSTDISSLNNYTSSTDSRLDTIETFTSSIEGRITTLENQTDNTGSDNQTLTIVGDQLTIVGGNTITIPTGSGGISTDISSLNSFTASYFTDSSSFDSRITTEKDRVDDILSGANADYDTFKEIVDLINSVDTTNDQAFASFYTASNDKFESLETFTESIEGRIATLENQTDNTGSDSQTLSIVGDQLTIVGGNTITIPTGSELPSGLISGSSQITELGFTSESTDISSLNEFTQSYFTDSASFDTRIDNLVSSTVPQGTISGSDQLTSSYDLRYL